MDIVAAVLDYDGGANPDAIAPFKAKDIARCNQGYREDWAAPGDFLRLGTVSASFRLPEEWVARVPGGIDQATIQATAMNLWHWTNFRECTPMPFSGSAAYVDRAAGFIIPPPKRFTMNLRMNF